MKFSLVPFLFLTLSFVSFADGKKVSETISSVDVGQPCVRFDGSAAKKTFLTLYPSTQGRVTAIVAEETRGGQTVIATNNIFCRVFLLKIAGDISKLEKLSEDKFQCGYFISSDGNLSACSDPL